MKNAKINYSLNRAVLVLMLAVSVTAGALLSGCSYIPPLAPIVNKEHHLITADQREAEPVRAVDSNPSRAVVAETGVKADVDRQMRELGALLQLGYKPELSKASYSVASAYEAAIGILNNIILNDMSDYERIHAIYDYLAYYTEYDNSLYDAYLADEPYDRYSPSFDARGPLLYKKAVCEGIAEAFVIMCGIEGIRSVMVTGIANNGEAFIKHAWNRVFLDDKWYNIDATFANLSVNFGEAIGIKNYLTHTYFLIDTESMERHEVESIRDAVRFENEQGDEIDILDVLPAEMAEFVSSEDYGFYAKEKLGEIDGEEVFLQANSQAELDRIFKFVKESKNIGRVEIKITFAEGEALNSALKSAYIGVPLAHYTWDQGVIHMANSTFLCFIYK